LAFVRVSRDKRGYEHIYLIDAAARRGKTSRPRVLYWFRTPPGVTVGRAPFDESVRRTLEAQYPDVTFDWEQLRKAAIAAPDVEPWRERRRVERAAKQARQVSERDETEAGSHLPEVRPGEPHAPLQHLEPLELLEPFEPLESFEPPEPLEPIEALEPFEPLEPLEPFDPPEAPRETVPSQAAASVATSSQTDQRRRRRRGGRRRRQSAGSEGTSSNAPSTRPAKDESAG